MEGVPELSLSAVLLTHDRTGAQHLHLARDDRNNAFGLVAFPLSSMSLSSGLSSTCTYQSFEDKFGLHSDFSVYSC